MIMKYIKNFLYKMVLAERSPKKLALSFCLGSFIAFTPTIPFQTPLMFFLSWLFRLNTTVTVGAAYLVNPPIPITIIPIYVANYLFGSWLLEKVLGINMINYNPAWISKFNDFLLRYIDLKKYIGGSEICFWCLIIGGIILPFIVSLLLYPIMKRIFSKLVFNLHKNDL